MAATEDSLAVALHQLERVLGDQLVSIGALSSKARVVLGFSITAAGSVVVFERVSVAGITDLEGPYPQNPKPKIALGAKQDILGGA